MSSPDGRRRRAVARRVLAWGLVAAVVAATLVPGALRPPVLVSANLERFAVVAVAVAALSAAYPRRRGAVLAIALAAIVGLELAQELSPSRHGSPADAAIKAAGALCGSLVAISVAAVRRGRTGGCRAAERRRCGWRASQPDPRT